MMAKRSRSQGIRPSRNAVVSSVLGLAGVVSVGLAGSARTSSVTIQSARTLYVLRVPVAEGAGQAANAVLRHYPPRLHN